MQGVEVTKESSMAVYNRLLDNPPPGPPVPYRPLRSNPYTEEGRAVVAVVRSDDRTEGMKGAVELLGGLRPVVEGVRGEILIKPNCNTDDPYPRDTHPVTVRTVAEMLIKAGVPRGKIVLGETSGRGRGLPTRDTLRNLGMLGVAEELGIGVCCFEEGDWVTVSPPRSEAWPEGIKIPRRVYEANRVILTPILRPHSTATFTIALKLAVGMLDSPGREWLHDGRDFFPKLVELNLAYSADLVIADASRVLVDKGLTRSVKTGIIIASGSRVASDAVSVALMRLYGAERVSEKPVQAHEQFKIAANLGLGSPSLGDLVIRASNPAGDPGFPELIGGLEEELRAG
ncbi:MAG: DUF362 domain-containing protein [Candidatus Bathyarchaeota archaeon]